VSAYSRLRREVTALLGLVAPTAPTASRYYGTDSGGALGFYALSGGSGTPASAVTAETAYGASSAVGSSTDYARADHTHGTPALGSSGSTACAGNDARLSDARTPTAHQASHRVGGSDALPTGDASTPGLLKLGASGGAASYTDSRLSDSRAPTGAASGDLAGTYPSPTVTHARGLRTSGGTTLPMGAVAEGDYLRLVGGIVIGAAVAASISVSLPDYGTGAIYAEWTTQFPSVDACGSVQTDAGSLV